MLATNAMSYVSCVIYSNGVEVLRGQLFAIKSTATGDEADGGDFNHDVLVK